MAIGVNVKIDFVEIFKSNRETVFAKAVNKIFSPSFTSFYLGDNSVKQSVSESTSFST